MTKFYIIGSIGFLEKDSERGEPDHTSLRETVINETFMAETESEAREKTKEILDELLSLQSRIPDSFFVEVAKVEFRFSYQSAQPEIVARAAIPAGFREI